MAAKRGFTIEEAIAYLNSLLQVDAEAISKLFAVRVRCEGDMAHSPAHVVLDEKAEPYLGALGVINGLFGYVAEGVFREQGAIGTLSDKQGLIRAFVKVEDIERALGAG